MRFRCKMVDVVSMRDFMNITTVISRMAKLCVIRLLPDKLCFSVSDSMTPVVWVEMSQRHFFVEYVMNGVSNEQNEIYLEYDAMMLAKSLNSLRTNANCVKIKLTNKQQPCLTIEIDLPSIGVECRQCVHDVPVRVISRKSWPDYQRPHIPEFDISIDLPHLKHVRNVVDRMKNMSPQLIVIAEKSGRMVLKSDTDRASVSTHFQSLRVSQGSQDEDEQTSATVDMKKFQTFLFWDILRPESVQCNILQDKLINLYFSIGEYLKIFYFIPSLAI